ncbi:carboxypeptidase-like regulatory domain-containing protein [Flavobacterium sp. P21]|uniref:carboxypeptidase-like regulatory domain-containing protein n=1 Tax=Flavobacterium sp. P21 TaxID=3423948 RepID=UPI003D673B7A
MHPNSNKNRTDETKIYKIDCTVFYSNDANIICSRKKITGTVTDNAGIPLPGVSILVKGTKLGAQTDFDGKYVIKASPDQTLVFTYIGMRTQEIATSSSVINVKLTDSSVELEGVVVTTAMGVKREKIVRLCNPTNFR